MRRSSAETTGARARQAAALAAIALAAAGLGGCGGSDDETLTTAATPAAETATAVAGTAGTGTPETGQPTTIEVQVAGGKPVGGIVRAAVARGSQVVIVVSSDDTGDEVRVHGYELSTALEERDTANISFIADTPGRFEVVLESLGVQIAELTVS